jgi:hypothetical protein
MITTTTTMLLKSMHQINKDLLQLQLLPINNGDDESSPSSEFKFSSLTTKIQSWNEQIELELTSIHEGKQKQKQQQQQENESDGIDNVTTVKEVANAVHLVILQVLYYFYIICNDDCEGKDCDELSASMSILKQSFQKSLFNNDLTTNNSKSNGNENDIYDMFDSDEHANISTSLLVKQTQTLFIINNVNHRHCHKKLILTKLLSQLIRSSKNIIRWNRYLLLKAKSQRKQCTISSLDACCRLNSKGMITLFLTLLETYHRSLSTQNSINISETIKSTQILYQDELTKNACVALFHSSYGEAKEPICQKTLHSLIDSKSDLYCITIISKLLLSSTSLQIMLALIKLVHNFVGSIPGIMVTFDSEIQKIATNETELIIMEDIQPTLLSILISTLTWSIRSSQLLHNDADDNNSQHHHLKIDIAIEIIRVLFALQNRHKSSYKKANEENPQVMTQLGILIVDILHLPNTNPHIYECKVSILILLMDGPKEFSHFLLINHCIGPLLTILWLQLNEIVIEKEGMMQSQSNAVSILPILILLNKLSQDHKDIKNIIKKEIFPPDRDDEIMTQIITGNKSINSNNTDGKHKNINPVDAPVGSMRWKLIKLMTWKESNVKRCASELLWTICDGNSKEFVLRTGFGNAVHMLGLRGLVNIPKSN